MVPKSVLSMLLSLVISTAAPGWAQSSLGITGGILDAASIEDEAGLQRNQVSSSVDVRVTRFHGLQGDLTFAETGTGTVGRLTSHLYMAPKPGQKYGLFFFLGDMDGRSMTWGSLGAEGMLSLGDSTALTGNLGLGRADFGSLDYIFGGATLAHELVPGLELEAALNVADFDEANFRATSIETSLTASYGPEGLPWGLYASATYSDLIGRNDAPAAIRIGLGMIFQFGSAGGTDPHMRPFGSRDPVAPLVRRGMW